VPAQVRTPTKSFQYPARKIADSAIVRIRIEKAKELVESQNLPG
jgi:hypothetical protein